MTSVRGPGSLALAVSLGLLLSGLPRAAAGQDPDPSGVRLGLEYRPGYIPALVIAPMRSEPALAATAAEVYEIVRTDLDFSDRFEIVPVPDSLRGDGRVNYALWNQLGAVWLVTGDVSGTPAAPILRLALHDVVYGSLKNVQAFSLPPLTSSEFRMVVHRASDQLVGWATDGEPGIAATRIAFRRRASNGESGLYLIDSDGEGLRRIDTGATSVFSPAFSPDADRIAYTIQDEIGFTALMEVNLVTGRRRTVSSGDALHLSPTYAPDGRLAYARTEGDGTEIFFEGGPALTRTRGDALNPSFSPDGRWLAFEADPLGQPQIYVQPVSGGSPRLISRYVRNERTNAAGPSWSPGGDRIAYAAMVGGVFQIFTVSPDGTDRRMLTSRGLNENPSWAPDGRHLVFSSEGASGHGLWILDTVTGRTRTLTSGRLDGLPSWSRPIPPGR